MKCMIIMLALLVSSFAVSAQNLNQVKELRLDPGTNRLMISFVPEPPPAEGTFEVRLTGRRDVEEKRMAQGIKSSGGLTVALILDTNMKPVRLQAAKAAAQEFVEKLNAGDRVSIIGFGDNGILDGAATQVKTKTKEDIAGLQPDRNNRRLRQALYQQSEFIRRAGTGRKAVMLVTDGEDDRSSPSLSKAYLIQYAKEMHRQHTEVPLYAITVGEGADASFYHTLSDITDGEDLPAARTEEIATRFDALAKNLLGPAALYRLEVDGPARDGAERMGTVEWKIPGGEKRSVSFRLQANTPLSGGTESGDASSANPSSRAAQQRTSSASRQSHWLLYTGIGLVVVVVCLCSWAFLRPRPAVVPVPSPAASSAVVNSPVASVVPSLVPSTGNTGNEELTLIKAERQDLPTAMNMAARPGAPVPFLSVEKGPHQGLRFEIVAPVAILGRGQNAAFQLPRDEQLSRAHAEISRTAQGEIFLRDMNSTNGTCVNDLPISAATRLMEGDRVKIGESELIFREPVT